MSRKAGWLATVLLVAACTAGPDGNGGNAGLEHLEFARESLWAGGSAGVPNIVKGAEFLGDSLFLRGSVRDYPASRLAVVDPDTGKPRWALADKAAMVDGGDARWQGGDLGLTGQVVGSGDGWTVLVPYTGNAEYGVAALSGEDGRVQWKAPVIENPGAGWWHFLMAADESVAVSVVTNSLDEVADLNSLRVVATEVSTGAKRWETAGMWPAFVTGDVVLGQFGHNFPTSIYPGESTVGALDAKSGKKMWDLSSSYPRSRVLLVAGGAAVIATDPGKKSPGGTPVLESIVVDARTGKKLADLGDTSDRCDGDGGDLIVCEVRQSSGARLAIFDTARRSVRFRELAAGQSYLGAWRGYILLTDGAVDRHGNRVSNEPPAGRLVTMSEGYALFAEGFECGVVRVEHRRA